jgi:hypothetical protein
VLQRLLQGSRILRLRTTTSAAEVFACQRIAGVKREERAGAPHTYHHPSRSQVQHFPWIAVDPQHPSWDWSHCISQLLYSLHTTLQQIIHFWCTARWGGHFYLRTREEHKFVSQSAQSSQTIGKTEGKKVPTYCCFLSAWRFAPEAFFHLVKLQMSDPLYLQNSPVPPKTILSGAQNQMKKEEITPTWESQIGWLDLSLGMSDPREENKNKKPQKRTSKRGVMQQVWSVLWVCSHHAGLLARSKTWIASSKCPWAQPHRRTTPPSAPASSPLRQALWGWEERSGYNPGIPSQCHWDIVSRVSPQLPFTLGYHLR